VLQRLVKANFLKSNRGPSGGFALKKTPKEISLLEIYEAIEGTLDVSGCPLNKSACPFKKCMMEDMVKNISKEFRDYLKNKTLKDYL